LIESKIYFAHQKVWGDCMRHQAQYWLTCPECGHRMEVDSEGGPIRAKYCDKCNLLFSPTNEELAAAESVEADGRTRPFRQSQALPQR
jgi:hypothetical protein